MAGATYYKSPSIPDTVAGSITVARPKYTIVIDSNGVPWQSADASTPSYIPLGNATVNVATTTSTVSNLAVETAFSTGSYTFAADTLSAGLVIKYFVSGVVTSVNAADTLRIRVLIGSNAVGFTPTAIVAANDMFIMSGEIVIRTASTTGNLVPGTHVSSGSALIGAPSFPTPFVPSWSASTNVNTTTTQDISVAATWSAASANNIARLDIFNVTIG